MSPRERLRRPSKTRHDVSDDGRPDHSWTAFRRQPCKIAGEAVLSTPPDRSFYGRLADRVPEQRASIIPRPDSHLKWELPNYTKRGESREHGAPAIPSKKNPPTGNVGGHNDAPCRNRTYNLVIKSEHREFGGVCGSVA